ncbi:hypothetical protein VNI00_017358 [Paramarasmius palmivorus]|uniref:Uncharacterized protein n=1 Tax=Paramarasmius palmivorus TaxID=297713 RepID=A0AAW0B6T5_9AGAR
MMLASIKLAAQRLSALSFFKRRGMIYGFVLENATQDGCLIKVGHTSHPLVIRMAEWDKCTVFNHHWFPGYEVQTLHQVGE